MAQLRPRVNVETQSSLNLIAPSGPGVIAMIGTAQWGPISSVVSVDNLSQAISYFKDDLSETTGNSSLTLIKGLSLAFNNGASTIKCVRVEDGNAEYSTLACLADSTTVITISGKYKGTYGDNIMATITANGSGRDVEITDGINTETYNNSGNGYTSNLSISEAITAGSTLVTATTDDNTYLVDVLTQTNLSGGDNGEDELIASDFTTAMDDQLNNEDFDILTIPGQTENSFQTTVVGKLVTRESVDDRFSQYFSGIDVDETVSTAKARTARGKRLSIVAPNVVAENRVSGNDEYLDGSYLACAYAGVVAKNWPNIAATHKIVTVEDLSINESSGTKFYNNSDQNDLLNAGIVPITKIGTSIMPSRAVTRITDITEVYFEQNIVSIVDYIRAQVITLLNGFIGDPNLERVRTVMGANVDGILEADKREEIITSYNATQVSVGTSPDTVDVTMSILPAFAINFINVTLTIER